MTYYDNRNNDTNWLWEDEKVSEVDIEDKDNKDGQGEQIEVEGDSEGKIEEEKEPLIDETVDIEDGNLYIYIFSLIYNFPSNFPSYPSSSQRKTQKTKIPPLIQSLHPSIRILQ